MTTSHCHVTYNSVNNKASVLKSKPTTVNAGCHSISIQRQHVTNMSPWSAFTSRLIVPRTKTSYGDRSFSVHGPSVWNSLPNDLRLSDMSLETFRSRLKAFLLDTDHSTAHLLLWANLGYINSIIIIIRVRDRVRTSHQPPVEWKTLPPVSAGAVQ